MVYDNFIVLHFYKNNFFSYHKVDVEIYGVHSYKNSDYLKLNPLLLRPFFVVQLKYENENNLITNEEIKIKLLLKYDEEEDI